MSMKPALAVKLGQYHITDLLKGGIDTELGCCFVYGSPPNHTFCSHKAIWFVKSNLRGARVCNFHLDEIVAHHKQFDKNLIIEPI